MTPPKEIAAASHWRARSRSIPASWANSATKIGSVPNTRATVDADARRNA